MSFGLSRRVPRVMAAWLLAWLMLGTGCATARVDWNSRAGNYTYDQALKEMGEPAKKVFLNDGAIVGDWLIAQGSARDVSTYNYSGDHRHPYG